jgi:hypothetical protein
MDWAMRRVCADARKYNLQLSDPNCQKNPGIRKAKEDSERERERERERQRDRERESTDGFFRRFKVCAGCALRLYIKAERLQRKRKE